MQPACLTKGNKLRVLNRSTIWNAAAAAILGIGAGLLVFFFVAGSAGPSVPFLTGLKSPRGLTSLGGGDLLVAEVLGGRLLRVNAKGDVTLIRDGLPATLGGPSGDYPIGISAAILRDQSYYYVAGEPQHGGGVSRVTRFSSLYRLGPDGTPEVVAGGIGPDGFPSSRLTNPYDLVPAPDGGFLVSDAGVNAVLHISKEGAISDYAVFPDRDVPGPGGPITMDVVPTGLTFGPDGALYLSSFTGYPYPKNAANIYRLEDLNGDGDAMDQNESTVFAEGFSVATDLLFEQDGALVVTEFSTDMLMLIEEFGPRTGDEIPGRVVRWRNGAIEVVAEGLISPTSIAIANNRVFVSEEFVGVIREINPPVHTGVFTWSLSITVGLFTSAFVMVCRYLWKRFRPAPNFTKKTGNRLRISKG